MSRSLVIGGTLFIGRALVDQLLARGDDVVIMHRGTGTPFGPRVGEIQCDRNDIPAVRAALDGEPFDFIYDNVFDWSRGTTAEQVKARAGGDVDRDGAGPVCVHIVCCRVRSGRGGTRRERSAGEIG